MSEVMASNDITQRTEAARHRLLEGVLLRLARRSDVGEFVLRGGMLLRSWFHPMLRTVEDVDLVATRPFSVEEAARRFLEVFADDGVADGVVVDPEQVRAEGIWVNTNTPGVRIFATGEADGFEADFHMDITFGPRPRPAPVFGKLPTACGEAELWMCLPEAVAGHKMQALWYCGMLSWRPKDLSDLFLLLTRVPMDRIALRGAIAAYLADVGGNGHEARKVFAPSSWWGMKMSSARWHDFVKESPGLGVPRDLGAVVAAVAGRLSPILEELP
jgi:hypothetical protein